MTTIYLIRHSVRMPYDKIESYNTSQDKILRNEKIILSCEGECRAKLLSEKEELQNIDVLYTSNCVRTLQTAKYMMESQDLKANIDERLNERKSGEPNDNIYPDWQMRQYFDENFKTEGGESQKEARKRMEEVIEEILEKHKDKRIAVFSHGLIITFFLLKYCELVSMEDFKLKYKFKNKIAFDKKINAPEVFKLTFEDKDLVDIRIVEFEDIPYNHGV